MSDDTTSSDDDQVEETGDKVLSDEEVDALIGGVESGAVEICTSTGPQFAKVAKFNVPQRSRLQRKRLPNLDKTLDRIAERLRVQSQQLLQCDIEVSARDAIELPFETVAERRIEPIVAVQFSAAPLPGHGALLLEPQLVSQIVEGYFGGAGGAAATEYASGFTDGEMRVAGNFAELVLESFKDVWQPLQEINPLVTKIEQSAHLLEFADAAAVVRGSFDFCFSEQDSAMHLLLPSAMIEAFLPYFRGIDREENPAQDQHWNDAISDSVKEVDVNIAVTVGDVTMTLGELICLQPGDVISIDNPRDATLRACGVPLVAARFGVHAGQNAIEARSWLTNR